MPGERPSAFGARGAVVLALGRCSFHNGIGGGVPSAVRAAVGVQVRSVGVGDEKRCARIVGEPGLVMQVVSDDHVHHGKNESRIGSRVDGDPLISNGSCRAETRIQDDEFRPVFFRSGKVAGRGNDGVHHVGAEKQEQVGVHEIEGVMTGIGVARDHRVADRGRMIAHDALHGPGACSQAMSHARWGKPVKGAHVACEDVPCGDPLRSLRSASRP